jgi:phage-related protein
MGWIKFRDKISTDFGVMEKIPVIPSAERNIQTFEIPYGTPMFLEQGWKPIKTEKFVLGLKDISAEHIYDVYDWLSGAGVLQTSREPDVFFNAICSSALVTQDMSRRLGKIEFSFTCESFRYANENAEIELELLPSAGSQKIAQVVNAGNVDALAEFTVTAGSGDWVIWVNDQYYSANGSGTYILNTEYSAMRKDNTIVTVNPGIGNLKLKPGINRITVTGNISKVKLKKNERWAGRYSAYLSM